MPRILALSDTHGMHRRLGPLPAADILIHAGDMTGRGYLAEMEDLNAWLGGLPHRIKIVTPGNHDEDAEHYAEEARSVFTNATVLMDETVEVLGLKIHASPWTPTFGRWAFMKEDDELTPYWAKIPEGLDILVTHGPCRGYGDLTARGPRAGSVTLRERIEAVKPRFHVFGHIHEGYGITETPETTFVNASICTLYYKPTNPPLLFEV